MQKRLGRWLLRAGIGLLCLGTFLALAGLIFEQVAEVRDQKRFPPPGQLIDVGGYRMHAIVQGAEHSGPTVVFISGMGGTCRDAQHIQTQVAKFSTVVAYDQDGLAWSEESGRPHDADHAAADLHALLSRLHLKQPFILAGHSSGGFIARVFAAQYSSEIAGVVFIDSAHPDQGTRFSAKKLAEIQRLVQLLEWTPVLQKFGLIRLALKFGLLPVPRDLPEEIVAITESVKHLTAFRAFNRNWDTSAVQVKRTNALSGKPIVVLTAGLNDSPDWIGMQEDIARLSIKSVHRSVPGADHVSIGSVTNASAVVSAVHDLIQALKNAE